MNITDMAACCSVLLSTVGPLLVFMAIRKHRKRDNSKLDSVNTMLTDITMRVRGN